MSPSPSLARHTPTREEILEHQRRSAVGRAVEELVKCRRKTAPGELVAMLHKGDDAPRVWMAMCGGMVNNRDRSGAGIVISFAGLCFARRRPDILRAILDAGRPQWMDGLAWVLPEGSARDDIAQFEQLGFWVPGERSRAAWLGALSSYKMAPASPLEHVSLFRIAVNPITPASRDFLALALEVEPRHTDIEAMRSTNHEGYALLTECAMRQRIAASPTGPSSVTISRRNRAV